MDGGNSLAKSN